MSRAFIQKRLPFKPTDIGGCSLWLDAADRSTFTLSGLNISQWNDKSGLGRNATVVGTIPLSSSINGISTPGYSLNTNTYFSGTSINTGSTLSAFAVYIQNANSTANNRIVSLGTIGTLDWNNISSISAILMLGPNFVSYRNSTQLGTIAGTFGVPSLSSSISTGESNTFYLNGRAGTTVASSGNFNYSTYFIGSTVGEQNFTALSGTIGEVILYNSSLTDPQRQQVESYLAQKWGLRQQLPQGHPGTRGIVYPSDPVNLLVRVPYQSVFTPSVAGTVSMWLDGTDPAGTGVKPSNGATVSTWVDKSGNGKNLTAVGTPTYVTASSSVYLNGASYLQNTNFNFTNYTLFIVSVQASDQGPLYTTTTSGAGSSGFFPRYSNGNYYLATSDGDGWLSAASTFLNGTTYIYSIQYNSLNNINLWSNGSILPVITGTAGTLTRNMFILGKRNVGGFQENMTGNVFEVVQYNSDLGQTSRQQVEGYLAWKWGLQANLPANHPYKNAAPSITNQFGISRPPNVLPIPPITISARSRSVIQVLISSGLLVRYRMNESSGSTLIDSVAGNNITIGGSPSRVLTSYGTYTGYALSIQNATQYGYITLPANMVVGAHSITSWVYFTGFASASGTQSDWVGWGGPGARGENHVAYNTGSITSLFGGPSGISSTSFLDDNTFTVPAQLNTWYFCVTTWDGSNTWKTYCYSPTTPYAFSFSFGMGGVISSSVFGIGISNNLNAQFGGTGYGGYIGEVRFYNRVLTAGEVASIYAGTG